MQRISLYLSDSVVEKIDERRGLTKRSPYVNYILKNIYNDETILVALEPPRTR